MIIDVNIDATPHLDLLKAAGVVSIFGYLDPLSQTNPKVLTAARVKTYVQAGFRVGIVSEGWGSFAHGGISAGAGERDGANAIRSVPPLGAPQKTTCVYFAVDTDASAAQIQKLVIPYFQAIQNVRALYRVGVYGSGNVCQAVLAANLADLAWLSCSMGWGGSQTFLASNKWALRQHVPTVVAGVPCDTDDANGDCGDFTLEAA